MSGASVPRSRRDTLFPGSDPAQVFPRASTSIAATDTKSNGAAPIPYLAALDSSPVVPLRRSDPFETYRRRYSRMLMGETVIAQKGCVLFAIKVRARQGTRSTLHQIPHPSFRHVHEIFETDEMEYIVYEHDSISLREVERCPVCPTESQVISLLSQVSVGRYVGLSTDPRDHSYWKDYRSLHRLASSMGR